MGFGDVVSPGADKPGERRHSVRPAGQIGLAASRSAWYVYCHGHTLRQGASMDTVEQLGETYFYKGSANLSAHELLFWIMIDTVEEQLGVQDV